MLNDFKNHQNYKIVVNAIKNKKQQQRNQNEQLILIKNIAKFLRKQQLDNDLMPILSFEKIKQFFQNLTKNHLKKQKTKVDVTSTLICCDTSYILSEYYFCFPANISSKNILNLEISLKPLPKNILNHQQVTTITDHNNQ